MPVDVKDMVFDKVAIGPVSTRIYQGADYSKGAPVLLYFGAGAFLGSPMRDNAAAECLAGAGAIVVVPDYISPLGGAFPKPLEVGFSIFSYLAKKRAGLGDRKSLLLIGGEEAGGNIAAAVAFKARDHLARELDGQVLLSPLVDPFMGSVSMREADAAGMRERWTEGWSHYLSAGVCHPYAAPCLCSRMTGLAPTLLATSDDDPLRDEAIGYAERLRQAGNHVLQHLLPAGAGWPELYGGTTGHTPNWADNLRRHFADFVRELGAG
ncbi:alpha/beta hydrolase fold domain-containing protein [Rhizobium sp. TRM95796]|uniref:alpha/beta hydrolase fold domain-containing protein n=1 Tax=Rhizobium sp. TRM95796 TaxID=2979862 RepID=UPI0021E76419|nr:alpha/beta hydrolase [Rhizobium sp. TRM95796]MCV3768002.1 alpha/beta hydrolase [Rhizobium sp. TRM95796]